MTVKTLADHFRYLDRLRESGVTNMWGASPFLATAHQLDHDEARRVHLLWMDSFDPDLTPEQRAGAV